MTIAIVGATVFFALSLFACFLAGLLKLAATPTPAPDEETHPTRPIVIVSPHGVHIPVRDLWEAVELSRVFADIDRIEELTA